MKRAYIIHRWEGNSDADWYPWLKSELQKKGFTVSIPEMPNTAEPKIKPWIAHLNKIIKKPDEETLIIAHSIGCQAVMRYVESLPENTKIGKVILVAGWFKLDNLEDEEVKKIARPWLETKINFDKIKNKINNLTVFLSDNEPCGFIKENAEIFKEKLNAKIIIEHNKGHFTQENNITSLPSVLEEIK